MLIFAVKGGREIENCKKHTYVIFEQPLSVRAENSVIFPPKPNFQSDASARATISLLKLTYRKKVFGIYWEEEVASLQKIYKMI